MPTLFAERALLAGGWREAVRIEIDGDGTVASVTAGAAPDGAERAAGPVVPGMPNLHSHAFQRAMAGLAERAENEEDSFWTWRQRMYELVAALGPEDVEAVARHLYVEMLKAGYTSVAEFHYLHHDPQGWPYADRAEMAERIVAAAEAAGIGLTLLPVFYAHGGFGGQPAAPGQRRFVHDREGYLALVQTLGARHRERPCFRLGVALHSLRAVTAEEIRDVLDSTDSRLPVHVHIAEQQREVDDCLAWSGARPIDWLFDHVHVGPRWCLVHATHATPEEVRRMAGSRAVVGLCPTTEANLGDGFFPAKPYLHGRGRFGIGSDSHVSVSVVEELRWLEYGQRLQAERRTRLASPDRPSVGGFLYDGALAGGAQALDQPVGRIEAGARADLVVLDGDDPLLAGASGDGILDRFLFAGSDRMVRDVMVGGAWAVRDGRHPGEEAAAEAFRAVARRLLG